MRYDMRCNTCGWAGEVRCRADDRHQQKCPADVDDAVCGAPLEVLIGDIAITRFGFGAVPSITYRDGRTIPVDVRKPATVKRGR